MAAQALYEKVLGAAPQHAQAAYLLGLLHVEAGRPAVALPLLRQAARLRPDRAVVHEVLGNALLRLDRPAEAEVAYRCARERRPGSTALIGRLAEAQQRQGRHADALATWDEALATRSGDPGILNSRALVLRRLGRHAEAAADFAAVLAAGGDDLQVRCDLAGALLSAGRPAEALEAALAVLDREPDRLAALRTTGEALLALGRPADALEPFARLARLAPDRWEGANGLGNARHRLRQWEEAIADFRTAAALAPRRPEPLVNLASALDALDRHAEALEACRAAIELAPDLAEAHFNMGIALVGLERRREAIAAYDRAIALRPHEAEFRFNRSHCHLALGDLAAGWADFAFLWQERRMRTRPYPQPLWDGRPVDGRVIVWGEQGVGDEVLAAGLLGDLAAVSRGLVVECDPRLVPLLRRSYPEQAFVARGPSADPLGLAPDVIRQTPMVYLPMYLRRRWDQFAPHAGYLKPDPHRVAELRARYRAQGRRRVVGISWNSANRSLGRRKSLQLADWAAILGAPDVTFVSLQYGPQDAAAGLPVLVDPDVDALADLDGFAAQVAAMDLVVTVSNSTAHFAGALGRPCWLLLPRTHGVLWYWLMGQNDTSPWYPSIRVFRQQRQGEWAEVIARVAAAIRDG